MPGDASLYIMNDSDSHIQLKDDMVVAVGQEALHIEEVSESDLLLTKWNGQSVQNQSNSSLHLDGIIGVEGEDDPSLTGNSGTISRVEKDEDIQELKSKSGQLDSNKFLIDCSSPRSYERYVPTHWRRTVQRPVVEGVLIIDLEGYGIFTGRY